MLPCPPPTRKRAWGDYYFVNSLANALRQLGHDVEVSRRASGPTLRNRVSDYFANRRLNVPADAVEIAILGRPSAPERTHRPRMVWLISDCDLIDLDTFKQADHLYVASSLYSSKLDDMGIPSEVLLQCTDPSRFSTDLAEDTLKSDLLFVGNRSVDESRPIVQKAVNAGYNVTVWGNLWDASADGVNFRGMHIANENLGKHYASANIVLNDHRNAMLENNFMSNRVYDSLACGRPVLTEDMVGIPGEFRDCAVTYGPDRSVA